MVVPQARSRISLAPSAVKKGRGTKKGMMRNTARKAYEEPMDGEGIFDVLKSVGKAVAPVAIDLAKDYAMKRLQGGMALPINISASQKRTLKRGGAIQIKPEMVMDTAKQALAMLPASAKKVMSALGKNKGIRFALKQGEDLIDRVTGKGLFDVLKSLGKAVAPMAIDMASDYAKKKVRGEGFLDTLKEVGKSAAKAAAPVALDLATQYAKKKISGGRMRKLPVEGAGGSPYVSKPYKQTMNYIAQRRVGGSFMPAGGSGIYPAGKYGGMIDAPIQLGSPYQHSNSPAMNPFIPTRGIQSYNPIGKRGEVMEGEGKFGSLVGSVLGNFLPF